MNTKKRLVVLLLLAFSLLTASLAAAQGQEASRERGKVVVANRASGSISVISARSDALLGTVPLPEGEKPPEPMYVTYSRSGHHVFVQRPANVFRGK